MSQAQYGFDNGFEFHHPSDNTTQYIYSNNEPQDWNTTSSDMPRDMEFPSSSFPTSPNGYSSMLQGYATGSTNTTVDSAGLPVGQLNTDDDLFQAQPIPPNDHLESGSPLPDQDHLTFSPADEEGEWFDEEEIATAEAEVEEAENINVDSGEFVVADASKVTNIEKAGIIRGFGASLEWQDKTGLWRKYSWTLMNE